MKSLYKALLASGLMMLVLIPKSKSQNLLDLSGWTVGQGSSGIFSMNGVATENIREWGEGPQGKRVVLWKSKPAGDAQADGGWNSQAFPINHTSMYRYTVWIKKANSKDGTTYLGCVGVLNLDGRPNNNPYFWHGDLPELNKWYLLVGYIHGSGDASTVNFGGLYDGVTGAKVINFTDFKFATSHTTNAHRSFLYYDPNTNDEQYFYAPRVDLVNGNEPTIPTLLGLQPISSEQAYFTGKVGIKTPNPGDYELAVNGKIRSKEVKVETANWPDYVFLPSYKIPTLQEIEKHIKEKGHLPGIPSGVEVEKNGVELGDMNKKLLQKIEELTLIIINLDKKTEEQSKELKNQRILLSELQNQKKNKK